MLLPFVDVVGAIFIHVKEMQLDKRGNESTTSAIPIHSLFNVVRAKVAQLSLWVLQCRESPKVVQGHDRTLPQCPNQSPSLHAIPKSN